MKTIGLLGGMSWESTALYYQWINRLIAERLGGYHSARIVMVSVDFDEIETLQRDGRWEEAGHALANDAHVLQAAGADLVVLCTNTMHKVAPQIESAIAIPLLHIVDATGAAITAAGYRSVGLLGTRFTMEEPFYRERLRDRFGLDVIVPERHDREIVHRVIFDELVVGAIREGSRDEFVRIAGELSENGAEAVIEGCTEIGMLLDPSVTDVPLFDTTELHARAAVEFALA
jgi:aspartate racemase